MSTRQRRRFDDDEPVHHRPRPTARLGADEPDDQPAWSTYPAAAHGPQPVPAWVVTDARAVDDDLGVLKTGKEADVSLVRRSTEHEATLLAAKRYRDAEHRMFHRDAAYLEGRRVRRSRETRAMQTRTEFGRELIAGQWAAAEFAVLGRLWRAGASVPYPVQLLGTELMMEFVGDADGVAAPRLAEQRPSLRDARDLFDQLRHELRLLADAGLAHGDLSPYNVLVRAGRVVLIDLPQAVDVVGNPQGFAFLRRDCVNICTWFEARGIAADPDDLADDLLRSLPG